MRPLPADVVGASLDPAIGSVTLDQVLRRMPRHRRLLRRTRVRMFRLLTWRVRSVLKQFEAEPYLAPF